MTHQEAIDFLGKGIKPHKGTWLDLGAGSGIFSKALAEILPSGSTIYAIDKDQSVLNISSTFNEIIGVQADFENLPELPRFDGILMANALHYVENPIPFLQKLLNNLHSKGAFVLIEYDVETGNPWVPFPISVQKWEQIAPKAGLTMPEIFNQRISCYGQGRMYAAISFLKD